MMTILSEVLEFPESRLASRDGIVAIGGDLCSERLLLAYSKGIFPWYNEGSEIIWWTPDPRFVLFPKDLKVSKSMKQVIRSKKFSVTYDTQFEEVINQCKNKERLDQDGTWITDEMTNAYMELHKLGHVHSVEVWEKDVLVGGLYGVCLGRVFFGESMFANVSNASKFGFISLVQNLEKKGFHLIDSQDHTAHLESLGAGHISRDEFENILKQETVKDGLVGSWSDWF